MYKNRKYRPKVAKKAIDTSAEQNVLKETQNTQDQPPVKLKKPNVNVDAELIPPSQTHEQPIRRYLSQRSFLMSQRNATQSQFYNSQQRLPTSFYAKILMECGVDFSNDEYFILDTDHFTFSSRLRRTLQNDDDKIKKFIDGIINAVENGASLAKLLSFGCKIILPNSDALNQSQESLMKIFFSIDFIQNPLLDILLKKIETLAINRTSANLEFHQIELILSHLKYIDHLKYGDVLCKRLLDILSIATIQAKQEILYLVDDLIDPSRHNEFTEKLLDIFNDDKELLTQKTVNTFTNMCISIENQILIAKKIISFMKQGAPKELYPSFTNFLLSVSSDDQLAIFQIIEDLRFCLKWTRIDESSQMENDKNQKEVFDCISRSLNSSKKLFDIWLKCIQAFETPKSIDLLILLMMMTINDERTKYLENIIRRKIKNEQYNLKLVNEMAESYSVVIADHVVALLKLLDNLFRDKSPQLTQFATEVYKIAFGIKGCNKKLLLDNLVSFVCEEHPSIGVVDKQHDTTTTALIVLMEIADRNATEIRSNSHNLFQIFELTNLTLTQFRMAMTILCKLAYSVNKVEGMQSLQDDIDLVMKKQVASNVTEFQNRGIVGIVQIIDRIIWTEQIQKAEMSLEYFEHICMLTCSSPKSLALCYDELASILSHRNKHKDGRIQLNETFLEQLLSIVQSDFQDNFVIDEPPTIDKNSSMPPVEYKYCLNRPADYESSEALSIGINIAEKIFNPHSSASSSIVMLCPIFNLFRILNLRKNENLEDINAVLGCAIVLPTFFDDPFGDTDIFDEYSGTQIKQILDTYFYTVNWMREIVSAFISDPEKELKKKVLTRLTQVIHLEEMIRMLIKNAPFDYMPPDSQFHTKSVPVAKFKKPNAPVPREKKKTAKTDTNVTQGETENISILISGSTKIEGGPTVPSSSGRQSEFSYGPKEIYRQIDPDIMLFLNEDLVICSRLPTEKVGEVLGLQEFKFVLEDLVLKMESIFGVKKFTVDQPKQHLIFPADFVTDLITFLPKIMGFLTQLTDHMTEIADDTEELFTDDAKYTKICIGLCLRLIAALYTWPEFTKESHRKLLENSLQALCGNSGKRIEGSVSELAKKAIHNIASMQKVVLDLRSAVHLFHIIKSLCKFADESTVSFCRNLCKSFLSRKWYSYSGSKESGSEYNILLDDLLKGFFADSTLNDISLCLDWMVSEYASLANKNTSLKTFPCFNKVNFSLLYRHVNAALNTSLTNEIGKSRPIIGHLQVWEKSCDRLNNLLDIVKTLEVQRNLRIFMKYAHQFLKEFLQHGIPMLESALKNHYERVCQLLKSLQKTTRYLHKLCCTSKALENKAIITQIPFIRQTVEDLVFKVKAALAANKCSAAFWMGILTNKDIHDKPLAQNQSGLSSVEPEDEGDDQIPDDDSLGDDNESTSMGGDTSSDVTEASSLHQPSTSRISRSRIF